jgi:Tol biopolymer transport system component
MKVTFSNCKKILVPTLLTLALTTLTACGNIDPNLIVGVAGEPTPTSLVNTTEAPVIENVPPTEIPAAFGHIIFVSNRDGQKDLFITTPDGSQVIKLVNNIAEDTMPRLSPDGTKIAYVSTANNNTDIYVLDLNSSAVTQVTTAPEKDSAPTWSPNSQQLAFESFRNGNFEIYVTNIDGSNQTRLTNDPAGDSNPVWSPNSNEIVFVSNRFGNADILLTNLSGAIFTLTTSPAPDAAPAWSPNGDFISYQTFTGDLSNLCLVGRDGLNGRCITTIASQYSPTVWSPDGLWIATTASSVIHLYSVQDGATKQLYKTGISPTQNIIAFSPDGLRIVFQAQYNGDMEIFSVLIPTNEFTQITAFSGYDGEAIWSGN